MAGIWGPGAGIGATTEAAFNAAAGAQASQRCAPRWPKSAVAVASAAAVAVKEGMDMQSGHGPRPGNLPSQHDPQSYASILVAGLALLACFSGMALLHDLRRQTIPFLGFYGVAFLFYGITVRV